MLRIPYNGYDLYYRLYKNDHFRIDNINVQQNIQNTENKVKVSSGFYADRLFNPSLKFKSSPWVLNQDDIRYHYSIDASKAIEKYEKLRIGNYLDLDGGKNEYDNSRIRKQNLSFLDKVNDPKEKEKFIKYYKDLTGFPDLKKVATNIKKEFVNSAKKTSQYLKCTTDNPSAYDILAIGYDGVSSVAKNKALPGSDLDKSFVLLRGDEKFPYRDKEIIKDFKWRLWENTDQRILNYNHDITSFPAVYTLDQIKNINNSIDFKMFVNDTLKFLPHLIYKNKLKSYNTDYVDANKFLIDVCKTYDKRGSWELNKDFPSRENIYDYSFFIEALSKGEHLKTPNVPKNIIESPFAKLINSSQISALKKSSNGFKEKYEYREQLSKEFNTWSIDKQYEFIKEMIKGRDKDNPDFIQCFKSEEESRFNKIIQILEIGSNYEN